MDLYGIWVLCSDDSHEGHTVKVTYFQTGDPYSEDPWTQAPAHRSDGAETTYQAMDPEVFQDMRHQNLMCKLCGLKVSARMGTLVPVLDRLKEARIASIELSHLGGIVT